MSDDPTTRPRPGSDDFDPKQHFWDGANWWTADRERWWDGVAWQPKQVPRPSGSVGPAGRERPHGFWRDFWVGLAGTVVGNGALLLLVSALIQTNNQTVQPIALALPWLVNIGVLIFFAIKRPPVLFGMLTAYGIALGTAVLAGILLLAFCFAAGSGGIP